MGSCIWGVTKYESWELVSSLNFESEVLDLSYNPQNNNLAIGFEKQIIIYFPSENKSVALQNGEKTKRHTFVWSPNGKYLISDFWDWRNSAKEQRSIYFVNNDEIKTNNMQSYKRNIALEGDDILFVRDIAWNYKSDFFAVNLIDKKSWPSSDSYKILVVKREGKDVKTLNIKGLVDNFAWHQTEKGSDFLAYTQDDNVFITNVINGNTYEIISILKDDIKVCQKIEKIAWSNDGKYIALSVNFENGASCLCVFSFDINFNNNAKLFKKFKRDKQLLNFSWGPEAVLAASYNDGSIVFYEILSDSNNNVLNTGLPNPLHFAWSRDGKFLAVANWGGLQVKIYKDLFYETQKNDLEI